MNLELTDHTALIVGGASGIGLATARCFAAEGAHVAIWDCSPGLSSVAHQLAQDFAVPSLGIEADVTDEQSLTNALQATLGRLGHIDHLVNAAAIGSGKFGYPFTHLTPCDWRKVLEVNVMGMTNLAHVVTPHMVERARGTMVFVASVAGQIGSQTDPPYSASKAANINFAQCMAKDLAASGIRVNSVCPGMVQTPLNRSVWQAWYDQADATERLGYEAWADKKIRAIVPLGKWQTVEAIADMIVFLSSARAAHVTGQTINVDGGFVMHC